jgi:cell division protein FtsN
MHKFVPIIEKEVIDTLITKQNTPPLIEEKASNKLVYKVQIGAYSKGLPDYIKRLYEKLSMLRTINHYSDDRGIVVYTIGSVNNFDDALKLQNQIRQEGVKDALVVAYYNGKRITLSEAKEMSKK